MNPKHRFTIWQLAQLVDATPDQIERWITRKIVVLPMVDYPFYTIDDAFRLWVGIQLIKLGMDERRSFRAATNEFTENVLKAADGSTNGYLFWKLPGSPAHFEPYSHLPDPWMGPAVVVPIREMAKLFLDTARFKVLIMESREPRQHAQPAEVSNEDLPNGN
jgi:hypothetical protein